jgi:cobalt-zinc-cadmium efflux system outer membrane protein
MKMFTLKRLLGLALVLWLEALPAIPITPAKNEPLIITEQQAIALFYQRNLSLIAANLAIEEAQAQEIIAAAIPNPVLGFTISSLSTRMFKGQYSAGSNYFPAISPQISQLIETAGKRRLRIESSELATEAITFDFKDTIRVLTNAVRHAYYNLLLTQKIAAVASENLDRYQKIIQINAIRLKAGDIAAIEFTRLEVESLKAQSDKDTAQSALNQARANLLLLLGWPKDALEIVAVEPWPTATPDIAQAKQEQLAQQALQRRPDLQATRLRIQQAEKMVTLAQRLVIPDVTVTAFYQRDPGNYFAESGGVGVSVPLPLFYRQEGEISRAKIGLTNAELALKQSEQQISAELMKALAAWRSADAILHRFEGSVLQRIDALRKAQEFAYGKGAVGLLDLIDAERNYKAMMLDYYSALANRSNAWADLLMAYGEEKK